MTNFGLVKNFTTETLVNKRRIVAFGASSGLVKQAIGDADTFGVSGVRGAQSGERLDVYLDGVRSVECAVVVTAGQFVTADADGRAIPAAPAAGVQMLVIGRALESGGVGAQLDILIQPQQITG